MLAVGVDPDPDPEEGEEEQQVCPVCLCPPEQPYCLALCGHAYCTKCARPLLGAAITSNQLPATCCATVPA